MSKKVYIISGSARKHGNSETLCDAFYKGAMEAGHDVEKVSLADIDISGCIGCYTCKKTGSCFKKDDMPSLLEKMIAADVIVLSSPVYFYSVNGQIKSMMDRTLPRYLEMKNKEFYFIVTAATTDKKAMATTISCFRGFLDCLENPKEKGIIYGTGSWQRDDIQSMPIVKEAYTAGLHI